MRLLPVLLLTASTFLATSVSAQTTSSIMHDMTHLGDHKDDQLAPMPAPEPEKKKTGPMFTVVGGGLNMEGEKGGDVTVLDDGGPATKSPAEEKKLPQGAAKLHAAAPSAGKPANDDSVWDSMVGFFSSDDDKKPASAN